MMCVNHLSYYETKTLDGDFGWISLNMNSPFPKIKQISHMMTAVWLIVMILVTLGCLYPGATWHQAVILRLSIYTRDTSIIYPMQYPFL